MAIHNIDLHPYAEGDPEFTRELAGLMIQNIRDLEDSLSRSIRERKPEFYTAACHKVKVTVDMVNDRDFSAVVEALRKMSMEKMYDADVFHHQVSEYKQLNKDIIHVLRKKM